MKNYYDFKPELKLKDTKQIRFLKKQILNKLSPLEATRENLLDDRRLDHLLIPLNQSLSTKDLHRNNAQPQKEKEQVL